MRAQKGGTWRGRCARSSCNVIMGAWWWNKSTRLWYCEDCARKINRHSPGLCVVSESEAHAFQLEEGKAT